MNFDVNIVEVLKLIALVIAAVWAIFLFSRSQELQRAQIYKDMEFKAIDLFTIAMNDPTLNALYAKSNIEVSASERKKIEDYAYCVLNLFELIFNLQKRKLITEEIFATWAPWYHEFSQGAIARDHWTNEAEEHYTSHFGRVMGKIMELKTLEQVRQLLDDEGLIKHERPRS